MASIISSGIGSGLNIQSLVAQLVQAERAPTDNRLGSREAIAQAKMSAFGSLKSALESFQKSLSKLQDATLYTARSASTGNTDIFTVSADDTAAAGTYGIKVTRLATNDRLASSEFAGTSGTGDLTISLGDDPDVGNNTSFTVNIDTDGSLQAVADAINAAEDNVGVSASVITVDGNERLIYSADDTGSENQVTISTANGVDDFDLLNVDPVDGVIQEGLDATIEVDGFEVSSANNTFDEVIAGVTITAKAVDAEEIDLSVKINEAGVTSAINSFVSSYNKLRTTLNDLTGYDPEANTAGLLQGDSTARSIASSFRSVLGGSVDGVEAAVDTLAELGITTSPDDGTLEVDSGALSDAVSGNLGEIANLFGADNGIATQLDGLIANYVDSNGLIDNRTEGFQNRIDRINEQREALNRRIIGVEERLLRQFTALDQLLGELQNSGNFLQSQLANLPGAVPINKK